VLKLSKIATYLVGVALPEVTKQIEGPNHQDWFTRSLKGFVLFVRLVRKSKIELPIFLPTKQPKGNGTYQ